MLLPFGRNSCPTMASNTELLPEDCDPMTTMDGNVRDSDCPTVCSKLRMWIIFLVNIIICSSLAMVSAFFSSSDFSSVPKAAAVAAPAAATRTPACFGSCDPCPPPSEDSSFPIMILCIHSGISTLSFVFRHPLLIWSNALAAPSYASPAAVVAPSLV